LSIPKSFFCVNATAVKLEAGGAGTSVTHVLVDLAGLQQRFAADVVVVACGAANSDAQLLRSANDAHSEGLANVTGQVRRNYMFHNSQPLTVFFPVWPCNRPRRPNSRRPTTPCQRKPSAMNTPAPAAPADDVPSDADIDRWNALGEKLYDKLLDDIIAAEEDIDGVAFGVWVMLTQQLAEDGWTAEDLKREVDRHVALGSSEGSA